MTPEQHGSKTEGRGTFACPICGQDTPHHHSDIVVAAWRKRHIHPAPTNLTEYEKGRQAGFEEAFRCVDEAVTPSPQSPAEPGRGDMLVRQERMAELEREIAELERFIENIQLDGFSPAVGTATHLANLKAELSRLRNEDGGERASISFADCAHSTDDGRCLFSTRNWSEASKPQRCVGCPGDNADTGEEPDLYEISESVRFDRDPLAPSPSDLPAREAIEPTDAQVEAACVAWSATWGHEFPGELKGSDIHDHAANCVRSTMRNALKAAALHPLSQGNGEAVRWEARNLEDSDDDDAWFILERGAEKHPVPGFEYRPLYAAPPSQPPLAAL